MTANKRVLLKYIFSFLFIGVGLFFYTLIVQANVEDDYRLGEFLVKFKNNDEVYKIKTSSDVTLTEILEKFSNPELLEFIEPNYTFEIVAFPSDPDYSFQFYLSMINAKNAWSKELLTREKENITRRSVIAILDTGVDLDHPDLEEKIWKNPREIPGNKIDDDRNGYIDDVNGWDFVENDADANPTIENPYNEDAIKHGTIVSSIAAAQTNNGKGVSGISWFSDIMPLRVLDGNGSGDVFAVKEAIDYAVANGADVINMSFVGSSFSQTLFNSIKNAYGKNILIVAAAGNTDPKVNGINLNLTKSYPVCYDGEGSENMVVGVASVNSGFQKSNFSNYGSCIDLVAPGEKFYAAQVYDPKKTGFTKQYDGYWSGTSLSAPLVSGALASAKALRPGFSADQIKNFAFQSTKNIDSFNKGLEGQLGNGLLIFSDFIDKVLGNKEPVSPGGNVENHVVVGLGFGSLPQVKLLRVDGSEYKSFFAYNPQFNGAVNVVVGDVDGDGVNEIITSAGEGGGPHIRILNVNGRVINEFFAYEEKYRGGINIASGDLDGDGVDEIITGVGKGKSPEVRIFDRQGNLKFSFLAYGDNFLGGVKVAVGDINGDGKNDIVTGAGAGGGPHVRIFTEEGQLISEFFAYNQNFRGGVNVGVGDLHNNGVAEIVVSVEENSVPTVRVFSYKGVMLSNFFAFEPNYIDGINVAIGDANGDGISEIVVGKAKGGDALIRSFNINGVLGFEFNAHPLRYFGGARIAIYK